MHYAKDQGHIVQFLKYNVVPSDDGNTVEYVNTFGMVSVIEKKNGQTGGSVAYEQGVDSIGAPLDSIYRYDADGNRHGISVKYHNHPFYDARYPEHEYYWHGEQKGPIGYLMRSSAEYLQKAAAKMSKYVTQELPDALKVSLLALSGEEAVEKFFNNKRTMYGKAGQGSGLSSGNTIKPNIS